MKRTFILFFAICLMSISAVQAQKSSGKSRKMSAVSLSIDGWKNDTIFAVKRVWGTPGATIDTLKAKANRVKVEVFADDTTEVTIFSKSDAITHSSGRFTIPKAASVKLIFASEGRTQNMVVVGRVRDGLLSMSGVQGGGELGEHMGYEHNKQVYTFESMDSVNRAMITTQNKSKLHERMDQLTKVSQAYAAKYVETNPNRVLAGYYFAIMSPDDVLRLEPTMNEEFRNGLFKDQIDKSVANAKKIQARKKAASEVVDGKTAKDFTLMALDGSTKKLSDFRGKWVVIDFWGSWCGWCIKGFPEMKKSYEKHAEKLEIVGVACGDKEDKWRAAVEANKLPWVQLINGTGSNDVPTLYGVQGFPTKVIVDPQGVIRATVVGESAEFYTKLDELVK